MSVHRVRRGFPGWLRLPRRTARLRFAALYGGLFLLSGISLVAVTYVLFERATEYRAPQLPHVPQAPAIHDPKLAPGANPLLLYQSLPKLAHAQAKLAQAQLQLANTLGPKAAGSVPGVALAGLSQDRSQLAADERQLAHADTQLTQVQHQLAAAVRQVAHAGSIEGAQRAADSHELLIDSGIALGIVAVLALAVGWLLAGRMLRPIRTITRTAQRISSASLHERLAMSGPEDELKELGDTLDDLFDRLEASFEAQRQFAANASHELRTPLARQRALIQVALADPHADLASLRAAHERVLASEQHLEQMIDALLTLTRGQAGLERRERIDLAAVASHALRAREAELVERGLEVRARLAPAPTAGDSRLLERLVSNLIDNAIRHNTAAGHIEIDTGADGRGAFVAIANTGPPIPPGEVERLFQPFQRLSGARTRHSGGHGLGLSIVAAIAEAHGARLSARPRAQGGLTVEVSFASAEDARPGVRRPPGERDIAAGERIRV